MSFPGYRLIDAILTVRWEPEDDRQDVGNDGIPDHAWTVRVPITSQDDPRIEALVAWIREEQLRQNPQALNYTGDMIS